MVKNNIDFTSILSILPYLCIIKDVTVISDFHFNNDRSTLPKQF